MSSDTLTPRVPDDATSSSAVRQIRIMICDDHAMVRGGIRRLLQAEEDFDVVAEAASADAAVADIFPR
jgi:PleD family two-component response regulator